jgi:putative ATP-dependent endonuclease of the OLD family
MLARTLPESSLRYINIRDDKGREIIKGGPTTNEMFARSLGVLPDNSVKLFIGVEGPNDIAFLQGISSALRKDGIDIPDLGKMEQNGEIIFFPMSGSNLAHWVSRLQPLNRPEFHLCDRDVEPPAPAKYENYIEEVRARASCRARSTLKKEIENYLHINAITAAYRENDINLPLVANFGPFVDVPQEISRLVHEASGSPNPWNTLSEEDMKKKKSGAKKMLCSHGPKYMDRALLGEVDPEGDLLQWFQDIAGLLAVGPGGQ